MPPFDLHVAASALRDVYGATTAFVTSLDESACAQRSRCAGWSVRDVLFHQLLDAQRALVAFHTTTTAPATTDWIEYWRPYRPGMDDAAPHAEFVRRSAAAHATAASVVRRWTETSTAAVHTAMTADAQARVRTQDLVLSTTDFVATLVVEATIHLLDMTTVDPSTPPPPAEGLRITSDTLAGLLGAPLPPAWDAVTCVLKATGRMPLNAADEDVLEALAARFPLLA